MRKYLLMLSLLFMSNFSFADDEITKRSISNLWEELLADAGISFQGELPVGIATRVNSVVIAMALDSMSIHPKQVTFGAFASITLPGTLHPIELAARNIPVGPGGLTAAAANSRLVLESEHKISLSPTITLVIPKDGNTYMEWTCQGFKALQLEGYFEFSERIIVSAVPNTNDMSTPTKVRARFTLHTEALTDWLFQVDMPAFKPTTGDIIIEAKNVWADLSDVKNPENMVFPKDYFDEIAPNELNLWRGFYAKDISIQLPTELNRIKVTGQHLIIDNMGVSVDVQASNLSWGIEAWELKIKSLSARMVKNNVKGGGLTGTILMPFIDNEPLDFLAEIYQNKNEWDYVFAVTTPKDKIYPMSFLSSEAQIYKGSSLKLSKLDGKFTASAVLHGKLYVKNKMVMVRDVDFQNLSIQSRAPYLTDGIMSISSNKDNRVGSFPISLDSLQLNVNAGNPQLYIAASLNLMEKNSFSASTAVTISSSQQAKEGTVNWKFDKVKIHDLDINAKMGSFELKGLVNFFQDDALYGNGFRGKLKVSVGGLINDIEGRAYFGCVDYFRYWQASLKVPTSIPLPVPSLVINSLKGGLAYHMQRPNAGENTTITDKDMYVPDKNIGVSFLAEVEVSTAGDSDKKVLAAIAELEVKFNANNGLDRISFDGHGAFLADKADVVKNKEGSFPLSVQLNMLYDQPNKTFTARAQTDINIAHIIKGGGVADILCSPSAWYMYVGKPSAQWNLNFLSLAKVQAYFMVGSQLEPMPEPPQNVRNIVGSARKGLTASDPRMADGKGMAFGSNFDTKFGFGENGGFIYAFLNVGAGADIMLRQYVNMVCTNRGGSVIGVNGWYASGQAYAYLVGKLGIRVRKKKFDILSLSAAALLQAELPNPEWFKGQVGAKYRLLGGLIKGSVKLNVTLGEQCERQIK